jgi:hypothetical protein
LVRVVRWGDLWEGLGGRTRTLMVVIMVLLLSGILSRVSGICFFEKCFGGCDIRSGNIVVVVVVVLCRVKRQLRW